VIKIKSSSASAFDIDKELILGTFLPNRVEFIALNSIISQPDLIYIHSTLKNVEIHFCGNYIDDDDEKNDDEFIPSSSSEEEDDEIEDEKELKEISELETKVKSTKIPEKVVKNERKDGVNAKEPTFGLNLQEGLLGLKYFDYVVGVGEKPRRGRTVKIEYTLRLSNGKKVDSSGKHGFEFRIGVGQVVRGMDLGVASMKVGGERAIVIPPELGYGSKGAPPDIPRNATLYFDIKLINA